ncbi:MAG: adenylate/guanylate cyclase domain-containing protein [Proteobacteria bacterium]|nr:adenylate/guanylate cyclase domain-containing protein [Pseudomonadota bacterium]
MTFESRRLSAIVSADLVGFSRLMGVDESGTLAALKSHRHEVFDAWVPRYGGRIVKSTGDGFLIEFASVVNAMRGAIGIQDEMAERNESVTPDRQMLFRMGMHVGDIIADGDDIFGDGVNIAARLEPLAPPGGVCLSDRAYWDVQGRVEGTFIDAGDQRLKNIASPVRVWHWSPGGTARDRASTPMPQADNRPSLAVLPFVNLGDSTEQEYLAEGITEDVITDLSRIRSLLVIARNSTQAYKGKSPDARDVGRDLGVRYLVDGSIRRAGQRVRTTARLVECVTAKQLWADRFEGSIDDVFALQDELTAKIVSALVPEMTRAEIARARQKKTTQLDAWDLYLRALPKIRTNDRTEAAAAEELLLAAVTADPSFAPAWSRLSSCRLKCAYMGWGDEQEALSQALAHARRAIEADPQDGSGYEALASVQQRMGQMEEAVASARRALELTPSLSSAQGTLISALAFCGHHEEARDTFRQSERVNPRDPERSGRLMGLVVASFVAGRFADAADLARQHILLQPQWYGSHTFLAASLAQLGRLDEAKSIARRLLDLIPAYDMGWARRRRMLVRDEDYANFMEGLRLAGVPDAS